MWVGTLPHQKGSFGQPAVPWHFPRSFPNPFQARFKPVSNPFQTRFQTRSKPVSNPFPCRQGPPNPSKTQISGQKPVSNPFQTRFKPVSNPFQTRFKPESKFGKSPRESALSKSPTSHPHEPRSRLLSPPPPPLKNHPWVFRPCPMIIPRWVGSTRKGYPQRHSKGRQGES